MRPLLQLFLELFRISLFVVGGGYAIIAAADDAFARRGWTKEGELLDHLPVFQMVPGLIATHVAVYVGRRVAGALGAAVGVLAVALPSVVIFTFVAAGYDALPLDNAWLTIADKSNTTGAEFAIGNNARMQINSGGKLIIDQIKSYTA